MSTARPNETLDAAEVTEYLRRHPDFLLNHPDAVLALMAPGREMSEGVVDLQKVMLDRQRSELGRLKTTQRKLIATNRVNLQTQGRVHSAVLAMIEAPSLEHLVHTVTQDLALILDLDVVAFAVEAADAKITAGHVLGITRLPASSVDRLIGEGRDTRLRPEGQGEAEIFGAAAGLVRSDALIRIKVSAEAPVGLIAFGSRRESTFHPSQGTELLAFLARALEISVRSWLRSPT
ncbi:MAG: DUF484 family protein [Alphaproteobacteria bacterium]|nr:DUF484 family protein [Alphaproteobacteria bacterium]